MVSDQRWMATEAILRRGSQLLVVAGHRVSRRRRLARTVDGWGRINGRRECGARDMPYLTSTLTSTRTHSDGCRRTAPRTEPGNFPTWRTRMHAGGRRESHPVCATSGKPLQFGGAFCRLELRGLCPATLGTLGIGAAGALLVGWLGVFVFGRPFGTPAAVWGGILAAVLVPWLLALGRRQAI
jgi:hypothetical protein